MPLSVRIVDFVSELLFWSAGAYHPGDKFNRGLWNNAEGLVDSRAGLDKRTGVISEDFDLTLSDRRVPLRLYLPPSSKETTSLPVIFYVHGGGFCIGSRSLWAMDTLCVKFCALGAVVIAVSYRLAPEHPFPAGLQDCYATMRWIFDSEQSCAKLPTSSDRSRVVLMGDSAGGNLACVLATLARDGLTADLVGGAPALPICHLILIYPWLLVPAEKLGLSPDALKEMVAFIPETVLSWFRASYLRDEAVDRDRGVDRRVCPLVAGVEGLPPITLISADLDVLRHDSRFMAEELRNSGAAHVYRHYEGVPHGFFTFFFLAQARAAFDDAVADLEHVLKPGAKVMGGATAVGIDP